MSGCPQYREQVVDLALGGPAAPEFQSHLASCPACAGEVERRRVRGVAVDAAVHRLANPQPAPFLAARILARTRVARSPWRLTLAAAALAVAVFAVGFWVVSDRQERKAAAAAAAIAGWRSPTSSLLSPPSQPLFQSAEKGVIP